VILAIQESKKIKNDKKDSQYYDLKGNKLEKPTKGINIINGKKVVIK
jgi:hypothetical protein